MPSTRARLIATALALTTLVMLAPPSRGDDRGQTATPSLALETRVERGDVLSRIIVSIRNNGEEPYAFETGARGGTGSLDDTYRGGADGKVSLADLAITGTRRTVVPEVIFRAGEGRLYLRPPQLSGPADRRVMVDKQRIAPKGVLEYASFTVPTFYVDGAFVGARLDLPTGPLTVRKLTAPPVAESATP